MALDRDIYRAFEDIVGPDYISEEPAILDGYSFVWGNDMLFDGDKFGPRHDAVILPGSAEEVQAVVRACNRFGVVYKAHASGFISCAISGPKGFVPLDLRRLNRIIDIDEKNMFAVVEPYVSVAELHLQTSKLGCRTYSLGSGGTTSVVASSCCHGGSGVANISAGHGRRTPMGVEWVLPNGEMVKLGAPGAGAGWFTGDGPGFSLRGVMRGHWGANGGLGVITKAAVKMVPWYGPPEMEAKGNPPSYTMDIPESFKSITITFPSLAKVYDAFYLLGEEEIAFAATRRGPFTMCAGASGSNKEVYEMWQKGEYQKKFANTLVVVLDASSPSEMEYKEMVLNRIIKETEGEIYEEDLHGQTARFVHAVFGAGAVKGVFRASGSFVSAPCYAESLDRCLKAQELAVEIKDKYDKEGKILADMDSTSVIAFEHGAHGAHMETIGRYDPTDPESIEGVRRFFAEQNNESMKRKVGWNTLAPNWEFVDSLHEKESATLMNYADWTKKLKKTFDPKGVSESSSYVMPDK